MAITLSCTEAMTTQITIPLYHKLTHIHIVRETEPEDIEPFALEDFNNNSLFTDQPTTTEESKNPQPEVPPHEPVFTVEQVQQEVQAAYDRGFAEGQEVASAVLETELRSLTERIRNLDGAILELHRQYAEAIAQVDRTALDLAVTIANAILGYEAQRSIECVLAQAQAALAQYHGKDAVTIRLHPTSLQALKDAGNPLATSSSSPTIRLVADPTVEVGGCILETALGTFDAQLRTQLENARRMLAEQLLQPSPSPDDTSNAV